MGGMEESEGEWRAWAVVGGRWPREAREGRGSSDKVGLLKVLCWGG